MNYRNLAYKKTNHAPTLCIAKKTLSAFFFSQGECYAIFCFLFLIPEIFAQTLSFGEKQEFYAVSKQALTDTAINHTTSDYQFVVGKSHKPVTSRINHPYFQNNEWVNGSLVFLGSTYKADGLKYNIEHDRLIYFQHDDKLTTNFISLDHNFIREFRILNSTFRYYSELKNKLGSKQKQGYYQVAYDGNFKILLRWEKSLSVNNASEKVVYDTLKRMYLLKNNKLIAVKNTLSLINQLKDKKSEIKTFLHHNKHKFNRLDESKASAILDFYENLPEK
ncbi:MAG: hypothetical protein JXB00_17235 [Bacteroidales bacterium]|nr:hypothetical protein [Bacteroidales bacterium]